MAKRVKIPFVTPSRDSNDRSGMSTSKMVNMFGEIFEGSLDALGTPGLSTWINASGNSVRGMINYQGTGYAVVDNTVYKITGVTNTTPTLTSLGTIATSTGRVNFSAISQNQLVVNDGVNTYAITPPSTLTNLTGSSGIPSTVIKAVAKDGFFLYLTQTNNQVWVSDLTNAANVNGAASFLVNSTQDLLVSAITNDQYIYFFNQYSLEIWFDAGTTVQPFARLPGGVMQVGTPAKDSPVVINEKVFFLAQSSNGLIGVMMLNGADQQVISDSFLTSQISKYSSLSDAFGWSHSVNGHIFYNITFPSADTSVAPTVGKTWSYDTTTGIWTEMQSYDPVYLIRNRHAANCQMFIGNKQIVGDYQSGYLYVLDQDNLSDILQGTTYSIRRVLIGPHINDRDTFFSIFNVEVDLERGVGLDGTGQGTTPTLEFYTSTDKGHTYSTPTTLLVNPRGQYKNRIRKGGCGGGYTFTFKIEMSDPIKWRVYGMTVELAQTVMKLQLNYG